MKRNYLARHTATASSFTTTSPMTSPTMVVVDVVVATVRVSGTQIPRSATRGCVSFRQRPHRRQSLRPRRPPRLLSRPHRHRPRSRRSHLHATAVFAPWTARHSVFLASLSAWAVSSSVTRWTRTVAALMRPRLAGNSRGSILWQSYVAVARWISVSSSR